MIFFFIRDSGDVEQSAKQIRSVIQSRQSTHLGLYDTDADRIAEHGSPDCKCPDPGPAAGIVGHARGRWYRIMNIMLANVRSRIREIGIRRRWGDLSVNQAAVPD